MLLKVKRQQSMQGHSVTFYLQVYLFLDGSCSVLNWKYKLQYSEWDLFAIAFSPQKQTHRFYY